jgi:hypothetical protein
MSSVNIGGSPISFDGTGLNSYASANALPSSPFVTAALSSHSNVAAAFGGASATVLGAGVQGAAYALNATGSHTYSSAITWDFDTTNLSGNLLVGLLDHASFGSGFDSLEFKISEDGLILVDQAFTTLFAAESYFDDRVLDLGTFAFGPDLHLVFDFNLVTSNNSNGFGEDFILGAASRVVITPPDVVPEPGTLPLFGFGLAALLIIIRRRPYYVAA